MASTEKVPLAHWLAPINSPGSIAIIALVSFILLVLAFVSTRQSSSEGNTVLLIGPPDSGKTAIFSTLAFNCTSPTHTSLQANSSLISTYSAPGRKPIRLVDIPGHPRIRDQFAEYLSHAKGVVFVVDANTVSRNGPAVAEHLHHILHALTSLPSTQRLPPLLILAHKTDLLKSPSSVSNHPSSNASAAITRVRTVLSRELTKRRLAQMSGIGVEGMGEEGQGKGEMGGLECGTGEKGEFNWERWEGGEVGFEGTSVSVGVEVKDENADALEALRRWIEGL